MPRLKKPKQLSLFPSPASRPAAARKRRVSKSPRRASKRAQPPAVDLLGAIGPEIVQKMAELAREGDVRAASLVFKLLESPGLSTGKRKASDENADTALDACRDLLSGLEQTVVGEIISLLAEADTRAKSAPGAVEPGK